MKSLIHVESESYFVNMFSLENKAQIVEVTTRTVCFDNLSEKGKRFALSIGYSPAIDLPVNLTYRFSNHLDVFTKESDCCTASWLSLSNSEEYWIRKNQDGFTKLVKFDTTKWVQISDTELKSI